jgi:membrane protein DedA with SNARE-associated domain
LIEVFFEWLRALPAAGVYPVLMAASALENVFPPLPADVAVALGGWISQTGRVSAPLLGILCWFANSVSAVGLYALGRRHGEAILERPWVRILLPPDVMAGIQIAYDRHGVGGIFWSRFLPGLRAGVMPFAGIIGMPARRAIPPALFASAIWYACLVGAGAMLGARWEDVQDLIERANRALAVVAVAATLLLALWLWRRSRSADPDAESRGRGEAERD